MKNTKLGNVLMVSNYPSDTKYAWWLMEHFWIILSEKVAQNGHTAFLAFPKITSLSETIKSSSIIPIELTIPWTSKDEMNKANIFLRENNISLIYFTDQNYFNFKYSKMRISGVKKIIIHDHTPGDRIPSTGLKGSIKAIRSRLPWTTADYVFCVSEHMKKRNIATTRIPDKKCIIVQNGIQPINCAQNNRGIIRSKLNLRDESVLIITSGRADPYKRFDFIIKCADAVKKSSPNLDIVFLLVGDGPAMPTLRKLVSDLNLNNIVQLAGFRSDIHDLLCASDIAIHAALGEGFSLSIIEYMSAGLPVLVPDIPSVSQAIEHNKTGIIYPKDDINTAASNIISLASNLNQRLAMGNTAKQTASNRYTLDICTDQFIDALDIAFR